MQPLLLFFAGDSCLLSQSVCLHETNFVTKKDIPLHIQFNLSAVKGRSLWFVFKHKHIVKDAKMLIKWIAVNSNHFIRYGCKITHFLNSQTLFEYISNFTKLKYNQNYKINI